MTTGPLAGSVEAVRERLLTAVLLGEYLPGQRLPGERDLAQTLGVARGTTRAALGALVDEGHLEVIRGRNGGYFVTGERAHDDGSAAQILKARLAEMVEAVRGISHIEGAICAEAARRCTEHDRELLRRRVDGYREAASGGAKQKADSDLHMAIYSVARVPALTDALMFLERRVSLAAPMHLWGMGEDHEAMEARATADHHALVEHIVHGRVAEARELAERHVLIDIELIELACARAESYALALAD